MKSKSVLLIGLGRFGTQIAKKLYELNHKVMAIDTREDRVQAVSSFVEVAQTGDASNAEVLRSLGVDNYDLCIVAIADDFKSSLITTSRLKELGAQYVVARASDDIHEKLLKDNGADEVVYPEKQFGDWTATRYTSDHVLDYIVLDEGYSIFEINVPEKWVNKSIIELDVRKKHHINIIAITVNGKMNMTVTPDTVLTKENTIFVAGKDEDIRKCLKI